MPLNNYPIPENENERLSALHSYDILDSLPEEEYNTITRLTSYICGVPNAVITFIDKDRQWFKAMVGMNAESVPRADSFCTYTILDDDITEVPDATKHDIFSNNPSVQRGEVKFYAGAPLIDPNGYHLGSLCVFDTEPKVLTVEQRDALKILATKVISHLVLRKQKKELEETLIWHHEFYNLFNSSPEIHCITDKNFNILFINQAVENTLGFNPQEIEGKPLWSFFSNDKKTEILNLIQSGDCPVEGCEIEARVASLKGVRWISWKIKTSGERWYASGRDITAHKQSEEQLEMLSLAASKVNNGIVISDADDKVVWANDSFENITGFNLEDVTGKFLKDVLKGKLSDNIPEAAFEEMLKKRLSYEVDLQVKRKDGKKIWISVINSVIRNENNGIEKQIRVIIDVTARKQTEKDLEILSSAAKKSPSGIMIRDRDSHIVWMNEAMEKITGYRLASVVGKSFGEDLIGPETDPKTLKIAYEALADNKPYEIELEIYNLKTKQPSWVYLANSPYFNDAGVLESQIMVANDISERKKAEQQLTYLSLVASNTLSGVVINDHEGKVEWVNTAFTNITGYSVDDVQGKHLGDVLKGELTDVSIIEKSRELSKNKQSFEVDLLAYRKDGQHIWLSVINSVILDKDGQIDKYIEVIIDITGKKKIETELISSKEEALQLSKAKDMFISVMSHEIRTPLNAVIGMSHLLMEDNPTESQAENLTILKFSAQNLLKLINDVLDFAKMDTGNLELEKEKVDLHETVHSIIASLQYNITGKGIYLKDKIDADVPRFILGDKTRLTQILINLINNAVKFTEHGGVTVELKVIEQSAKDVRIRFAVTDTGIGIAKDKLGTIFESFKQAELDTTRKYGGTGLGLAITKRLIELHDSRIIVDSVLGKGSTFWFTITFKKVDGIDAKEEQADSALNLHALVVDDNQINRLLINKVLKKWGATADFAEDGTQAVNKIENDHSFDVVLMDIHMPVMGGLEAAKVIRAKDEDYYKNLPIIALTASMLNNQMGEINEAGMNDYVLKPFDPKVLHDKLSKYQKQ